MWSSRPVSTDGQRMQAPCSNRGSKTTTRAARLGKQNFLCSTCFLYFFAPPAFCTFFASPAFCTFKPFCRYCWTVLASQRYKEGQYCVFYSPWINLCEQNVPNKAASFFCWKTYCSLTGWVATNFIEVKVSKVSVQMVILRCIWINRAEQALKHFQLCSQAVKCKCISLYWGTSDRSAKKDGKNCQIFWHRFHGRADILKKDSVMKLKRRRRILLKSIIISGWIWGPEEEKEKSVGE